MSEEPMPKNYRLLKGIVITLGILIVIMVIVIIIASIMKYNNQKMAEAVLVEKYQNSQNLTQNSNKPFNTTLSLMNDQKVIGVETSDEGILLQIGKGDMVQKIVLMDFNGNIKGTINLENQ